MLRDVGKRGEPRPPLTPGEGGRTAEQWERALDTRPQAAERRDADADERDRHANERDEKADERERLADLRDRELLTDSVAARLRARLETMPVIEQAKGMLMGQEDCTADQAFDLLRKASQRSNVPIRELAVLIVARNSCPSWPWREVSGVAEQARERYSVVPAAGGSFGA
jgi:ANTAR domain